jgi:hypothetical protein
MFDCRPQIVPRVLNAALTEAPRTPTSAAYFSMLLCAAVAAAPSLVGEAGTAGVAEIRPRHMIVTNDSSRMITSNFLSSSHPINMQYSVHVAMCHWCPCEILTRLF